METVKFNATIGGVKHTVLRITDNDTNVSKQVGKTHHFGLLDRSYSMAHSIDDEIDAAFEFFAPLVDTSDLISILWFSGQGQFGVITRGSTIDSKETVQNVLENYRSVVGATCFSEVLREVSRIAYDFKSSADQTTITLFTDGCPVVSHSYLEELKRCQESIAVLVNDSNLVALNSVGYGNYYNRGFLEELSSATDLGTFVHSRDVRDFSKIFETNAEVALNTVRRRILVESKDAEIVYATDVVRTFRESFLDVANSSKTKNVVYVIHNDKTLGNAVYIDGEFDRTPLSTQRDAGDAVEEFMYTYANVLYSRGKRQKAIDIVVNNIKDVAVADSMMNAFTADEVSIAQEAISNADVSPSQRFLHGHCGPGYLPKKDAFCLMDLFGHFFANGKVCYVPFSENVDAYKRISRKSVDEFNVFRSAQEEVVTPISDFVWNKDLLNLSIQFSINGTVQLNPRSAERVGLDSVFKTKMFRNHTIIKDGNLNIKKIEVLVPDEILALVRSKVKGTKIISFDSETNLHRVVLDLTTVPIVNRKYIENQSLESLASIVVDIAKFEGGQKVINDLLKSVSASHGRFQKTDNFATYTVEQIEVLKEHGISSKGWYNGVSVSVSAAEQSDSYQARILSFYLKGASSLPSIDDFKKMVSGEKKTNVPGKLMVEYYSNLLLRLHSTGLSVTDFNTKDHFEFFNRESESLKKGLQTLRNSLNISKLAKVLTNDFYEGLTPTDKGDYTFDHKIGDETYTIVLRSDYKTVYF